MKVASLLFPTHPLLSIFMKQLSIIALGSLAVLGACTSRPANQFDLKGDIDGADGRTIYLTYYAGDSAVTDSTVITDGAFAFTGSIDRPVRGVVYFGVPDWNNKAQANAYFEPAEMTVTGLKADDFSDAVFSGSATQDDVTEYDRLTAPVTERIAGLRAAIASATDDATRNILSAFHGDVSPHGEIVSQDYGIPVGAVYAEDPVRRRPCNSAVQRAGAYNFLRDRACRRVDIAYDVLARLVAAESVQR